MLQIRETILRKDLTDQERRNRTRATVLIGPTALMTAKGQRGRKGASGHSAPTELMVLTELNALMVQTANTAYPKEKATGSLLMDRTSHTRREVSPVLLQRLAVEIMKAA